MEQLFENNGTFKVRFRKLDILNCKCMLAIKNRLICQACSSKPAAFLVQKVLICEQCHNSKYDESEKDPEVLSLQYLMLTEQFKLIEINRQIQRARSQFEANIKHHILRQKLLIYGLHKQSIKRKVGRMSIVKKLPKANPSTLDLNAVYNKFNQAFFKQTYPHIQFIFQYNMPTAMAYHPGADLLYVGSNIAPSFGVFDFKTRNLKIIKLGERISGLNFTSNNILIITNNTTQQLEELNPSTNQIRPLPNSQFISSFYTYIDPADNIYYSDSDRNLVYIYDYTHKSRRVIISAESRGSGLKQLNFPLGVLPFPDGVLIADSCNNRVVFWEHSRGIIVQAIQELEQQQFWYPQNFIRVSQLECLLLDSGNNRVLRLVREPDGTFKATVQLKCEKGQRLSELNNPTSIGLIRGKMIIGDWYNNRILKYNNIP